MMTMVILVHLLWEIPVSDIDDVTMARSALLEVYTLWALSNSITSVVYIDAQLLILTQLAYLLFYNFCRYLLFPFVTSFSDVIQWLQVVRSPSFSVEDNDDADYDVKVGVIEDTLQLLNLGYLCYYCYFYTQDFVLSKFACYSCCGGLPACSACSLSRIWRIV